MLNSQTLLPYLEKNKDKVRVTKSERYPVLSVVKYKNKVFYDDLWDDYLVDMRGLVVDADYRPVIMPFRKVFNRHERDTDLPLDTDVVGVRKINGFMAAVTYVERVGKVVISTTGSLDSPFVDLAREMLTDYTLREVSKLYNGVGNNYTWLFEIVHPKDPHVIPEQVGAYLIGRREVGWDGEETIDQEVLDMYASKLGVRRPEWDMYLFEDLVEQTKECKHEGYMVHSAQGTLKLKSPYYKVTKLFGRMKNEKFEERILSPDKQYLKNILDEEYYPLLDDLHENKKFFMLLNEQGKFAYIREKLEQM